MSDFTGMAEELLRKVDKEGLDAAQLPLAEVTGQGLVRLRATDPLDLEAATGFLLTVAKLLDRKVRALLPPEKPVKAEGEAEEEDEEGGEALVARLLEYRGFKDAAGVLRRFEAEQSRRFPRGAGEEVAPPASPHLEGVTLDHLLEAFRRIWEQASDVEPAREIPRETLTVAARTGHILRQLRRTPGGEVNFTALFEGQATRREVIVTFLAILELVRQERIVLRQEVSFGEILIRLRPPGPGAAGDAPTARDARAAGDEAGEGESA